MSERPKSMRMLGALGLWQLVMLVAFFGAQSWLDTSAHARVDAAKGPVEAGVAVFLSGLDGVTSLATVVAIWAAGSLFFGLFWVMLRAREGKE